MYLIGETIADQRSSILNEIDVIHRFDTLIIDACKREVYFPRGISLWRYSENGNILFILNYPLK